MKTQYCSLRAGLFGFLSLACAASLALADTTNIWELQLPLLKPQNSYLSEVGPHSRTWTMLPSKANRQAMEQSNPQGLGHRHVEELETGMNYYDGTQWAPSEPVFELNGNSFLANKVQHKINIAADDINVGNAVEITVPGGGVIQSTPVAIGLYDTVSGDALIIGHLTNSPGAQLHQNQVVFENAFSGVCADVVYTIEKGSFAQDVVITGKLNPEDYGFSTNTTRIQIFTEVYNEVNPDIVRRPILIEADDARRAQMASPDFIDNTLTVGDISFGPGNAYLGSAEKSVDSGALVAKEWVVVNGRRFLVESVEYSAVRDQIQALPDCNTPPSSEGASIQSERKPLRKAYASIPSKEMNRAKLHASNVTPKKMASARTGLVIDYQLTLGASSASGRLFSSDVTYLISGIVNCSGTTTFEGGTCLKYTTAGSVVVSGSVACKSSPYSPIVFTASDDNSVGDVVSTAGVIQTNGYANPALYFSYASNPGITNAIFRYCKTAIRSDIYPTTSSALILTSSQIIDCIQGVSVVIGSGCGSSSSGCSHSLTVNNTLIANASPFPNLTSIIHVTGLANNSTTSSVLSSALVATSDTMSASSSVSASLTTTFNNCTVSGSQTLGVVDGPTTLTFVNSILAGVSSLYSGSYSGSVSGQYNGFYSYGTGQPFGTAYLTTKSSPFVDSANLSFYLTDSSNFRAAGTTNSILPLLSGFNQRSTTVPGVISSINSSATLSPFVPRYVGGGPDLGYYYPALDYTASEIQLGAGTNVNITFGTAIGIESHTTGFRLAAGASVTGTGTPTQPIVFAPTALVQTKATSQSSPSSTIVFTTDYHGTSGSVVPNLQFRFANFYLGSDDYHVCSGQNTIDGTVTNQSASSCMNLGLRDCVLHGGKIGLGGIDSTHYSGTGNGQIGWTNNLFERIYLMANPSASFTQPIYGYNNLFYRGILNLTPPATGWLFHDTLYDQAVFSQNGTQSIDWNYNVYSQATTTQLTAATQSGWVTTPAATPTTTGANSTVTATIPTYYTGAFGKNYFISSAAFFTSFISGKGSQNADLAGLCQYTSVTNNNVKEVNGSKVNIGLHYVAAANGVPVDTDVDGLPDYFEDSNGNGSFDAGVDASNLADPLYSTANDGIPDAWRIAYFGELDTDNNQGASDDYDGNGVSNLDAYNSGTDPNIIQFYVEATNNYTPFTVIPLTITVQEGVPSKMAWLLDTTNTTSAIWKSYSTNVFVNIGQTAGWHTIFFGLKGMATTSTETWMSQSVYLDRTAPIITLTSPTNQTVARPYIQVTGTANEELSSVTYNLSNAAVTLSAQTGYVTQQHLNTNTMISDSASFWCYDLPLTNGVNTITLYIMDLSGNMTTTNFSVTLDYSSDTTPPVISNIWPTNGSYIGGSQISACGRVDDETAAIIAQIVDTTGQTNSYNGIVERNGQFWLDNLPLDTSTTSISIIATDAAGNSTTTNITYIKSAVTIQVTPLSDSDMNSAYASMGGTISDPSYTVTVNGATTTSDGSTNWSTTTNAPVYSGGASTVTVTAFKAGQAPVVQTLVQDAPAHFYYGSYQENWTQNYINTPGTISCNVSYESHYDDNNQLKIKGSKVLYEDYSTTDLTYVRITTDSWDECGATETLWTHYRGDSYTQTYSIAPPSIPALSMLQLDPPIQINHFDANNVRLTSSDWGGYIYTCSARSLPKIKTAGRSSSQSLYTFALTNYKILNSSGIHEDIWDDCIGEVLPANQTQVMGKSLGYDWARDVVLPDNSCVSVNVESPGNHHSIDVTPAKPVCKIRANGFDLSTTTPEFCVGEKVEFTLELGASRPVAQSYQWTLPDKYVNKQVVNSVGSTKYSVDSSLLTNSTTSVWYVNGKGGHVTCKATLFYSNGQQEQLTLGGDFTIYRPTASVRPLPPFTVCLGLIDGALAVQLGKPAGGNDTTNGMKFEVTITSKARGMGAVTQKINANRANGDTSDNTSGGYWLDHAAPYHVSTIRFNSPTFEVYDAPGYNCKHSIIGGNITSVVDYFVDYVQFRPDAGSPTSNIYVTLGQTTWNWSGTSIYSSGQWSDPGPGSVVNPPSGLTPSDEFPTWTNIFLP